MYIALFAGLLCVTAPADAMPVSFAHEVQPLLTRLGCNQGACHGAQLGQGGFKLSLRGFDDLADQREIVRGANGRRVDLNRPENSLFLRKATAEASHVGGKRLDPADPAYRTLANWLAQGALAPKATEAQLVSLAVDPPELILKPKQMRDIKITARFGTISTDVADRVSIESLNVEVATVDGKGHIVAKGRGETLIVVRFESLVQVCRVIVPHEPPKTVSSFKPTGEIDRMWLARWAKLGLQPAGMATDAEFLRRLWLSATGSVPDIESVRSFLADTSSDRHNRAIDRALSSPEYVDHWSYKWGDMLRVNRDTLGKKGMWAMHGYLREAYRENRPLDQMVGELLAATGSPFAAGPPNFFMSGSNEDWTEAAAQLFLGVRIQCARCHHHPFESLSQSDYYGFAAVFARVGKKGSSEFGLQGNDTTIFIKDDGESRHARTGQIMKPRALTSPVLEDPIDRRQALARWLSDRTNPVLARNMANRLWGYVFGRGLVDPVDDLRSSNPCSNPELLDGLAASLIRLNYDQKKFLKEILGSTVFRLSSIPANNLDAEGTYATHFQPRRLSAEQMLDAVDMAAGTREKFPDVPLGYRASSLPDVGFASRFLDVFGRPRRVVVCECERSTGASMSQALLLMSGTQLQRKVSDPTGRVARLAKGKVAPELIVEELYLASLGRKPDSSEMKAAIEAMGQAANSREGAEDLLWALLNCREFQFNH
jgi:hypothetical protein